MMSVNLPVLTVEQVIKTTCGGVELLLTSPPAVAEDRSSSVKQADVSRSSFGSWTPWVLNCT